MTYSWRSVEILQHADEELRFDGIKAFGHGSGVLRVVCRPGRYLSEGGVEMLLAAESCVVSEVSSLSSEKRSAATVLLFV